MKFIEHIREIREQQQIPQRQLAAALGIDTATYCKIEKGERKVKGNQVLIIANILRTNKEDLLAMWIADQVPTNVKKGKIVVNKALNIVKQNLK